MLSPFVYLPSCASQYPSEAQDRGVRAAMPHFWHQPVPDPEDMAVLGALSIP